MIRRATADDRRTVERLAVLDAARAPQGDVLVGVVAGEAWAAIELASGHTVADPFRPSAHVASLLRARAEHVSSRGPAPQPAPRRARWRRALRLA